MKLDDVQDGGWCNKSHVTTLVLTYLEQVLLAENTRT